MRIFYRPFSWNIAGCSSAEAYGRSWRRSFQSQWVVWTNTGTVLRSWRLGHDSSYCGWGRHADWMLDYLEKTRLR